VPADAEGLLQAKSPAATVSSLSDQTLLSGGMGPMSVSIPFSNLFPELPPALTLQQLQLGL